MIISNVTGAEQIAGRQNCTPPTMAGLLALLRYAVELEGGKGWAILIRDYEEDNETFIATIAESLQAIGGAA